MAKKRLQSPSSMNTYLQCPRKYFYIYKLRIPGSPSIHLVRGSVAHLVLEKLYSIVPEVIGENYKADLKVIVIEMLKKFWRDSKSKFDELKMPEQEMQGYFDETKEMLLKFLDVIIKRIDEQVAKGLSFPEAFKAITPKVEAEYLSWDYYVKGFIDVIETVDGKVRLMDYKTSKRAKMTDAYKLQLAVYALLYQEKHKKLPDEVGIYFLKHDEMCLPVNEELIKHAQFTIEQIHMSTDTDELSDYPQKQTPLCKWSTGQCDYYDYCFKNKEIPKEPLPSQWKKK